MVDIINYDKNKESIEKIILNFNVFPTVHSKKYNFSLMTGFERQTSGIGSNCSADWPATSIRF